MLATAALLFSSLGLLLLDVLPGPGRKAAEKPPQQVNGMLGGSAEFPLDLPPAETVAEIDWSFQTGLGPELRIAELRGGKLEPRNTSPGLGQRLEMADETTLRIRALEKEDGGLLTASVLFATGVIHKQTFRLSVFEPLPDPQIRYRVTSKTAEGCNLTLQCLASGKQALNVSWKRGGQLGAREEGSDWEWFSAEGMELHMSWRPNSPDPTVTCLLSNPVDQKNTSVDLPSICPREGRPWLMWLLLLLILVPVSILVGRFMIDPWRKRLLKRAFPPTTLEKEGSAPELQYADLRKRRSPPKGYKDQDPDPRSPCLVEIPTVTSSATVYATLQPPPAT